MSKTTDIQIVLARSGATEWDDAGRLQGETDLPLSESGRTAARAMAQDASATPVVTVLTGPDEACRETAGLIADQGGAKLRVVEGLSEMSLGLWEGLLEAELTDRYSKAYRQWCEDPAAVTAPEGESLEEAQMRILGSLGRALDRAGRQQPVSVVLRPLAFAIVRCWMKGRPAGEIWSMLEDEKLLEEFSVPRERVRTLLQDVQANRAIGARS